MEKKSRWTTKKNWGFWVLVGAFVAFLVVILIRRSL